MRKHIFKSCTTLLVVVMTTSMLGGCANEQVDVTETATELSGEGGTIDPEIEASMQASKEAAEKETETTTEEVTEDPTRTWPVFAHVNEYLIATDIVNLHIEPVDNSIVAYIVRQGDCLKRTGYGSTWSRVEYKGQEFYILSKYLRNVEDGEVIPDSVIAEYEKENQTTEQSVPQDSTQSSSADVETVAPSNPSVNANVHPADYDAPQDEWIATSDILSVDQILGLDNTTINWGYALDDRDAYNRPNGCLYYRTIYSKYNADFIRENTPTIYLTFDEGYECGFTPAILDTLKAKDAKAVFFVSLSYCKNNPELVQRMIDEGHIIGNHTDSHPSGGIPQYGADFTATDVMSVHDYVQEHFGYTMHLFRYPEGAFSEQSLALLQSLGYKCVFWSFAHADWDPDNQPGKEVTYERVTSQLHNGAIYLLHAESQSNSEALGDFIDCARNNGYTIGQY